MRFGYYPNEYKGVSVLVGKVISEIKQDEEEILFHTTEGELYRMYHEQDCCESVTIEEIIGDLEDLVGSPILMAEESSNSEEEAYGSATWTFYKFATNKGYVTIRWYGSSNGYYSESVDFVLVKNKEEYL